MSEERIRTLYLLPGPVLPQKEPAKNKFHFLSPYLSGHILSPVWGKENRDKVCSSDNTWRLDSFTYHFAFTFGLIPALKLVLDICFFLSKGLKIYFLEESYQVIITYGTTKTGLAGLILKYLTRTPLILEIPGNPSTGFILDSEKPSLMQTIKYKVGLLWSGFILNQADGIHLLYPSQLESFKINDSNKIFVFHDFVAIESILATHRSSKESTKELAAQAETSEYLLFLGYPWYLKGVDILIKAFQTLSPEFPQLKLKIVGFCPDKSFFRNLAADNKNIELLEPVHYEQAVELMSKCKMFILPSRTEAMGRVLLEAMACKKPLVASRVDGIPHYIEDGKYGLLFTSEDEAELAKKIRLLLTDTALAESIAEQAHHFVKSSLNEKTYARSFVEMVHAVAG